MNFNFGEVLTRAWQITWKYKVLWIFGILASCSRSGGGANSSYRFGQNDQQTQQIQPYLSQAERWLVDNWWVIALAVLVLILLMLLFIFLGTIGRIGMIRGTLRAEAGAGSLSFSNIFQESLPHFWPVFGLSFLIGLIFFALFLFIALGGLLTAGIGFICLLPLLCILVPIAIVVGVIVEQANVAIVKENLGLVQGWTRGWNVAKANPGPIIVMALILWGIGLVIGFILAIPILVTVIPAAIAFAVGQGQNWTPLIIAGAIFLVYLPIMLVLQGILTTFTGASWTLTYLRLTGSPADNTPVVVEPHA